MKEALELELGNCKLIKYQIISFRFFYHKHLPNFTR